jgi:hypothetical protein
MESEKEVELEKGHGEFGTLQKDYIGVAADEHEKPTRLSISHSNQISFSDVEPVDVEVRNLAVTVDISPSALSLDYFLPRRRAQNGDAQAQTKEILHSVSGSM